MEPAHHDSELGLDRIDREALRWMTRLLSGEASVEELREFERWRDRSSHHARACSRAGALWRELGPALAATSAQAGSAPRSIPGLGHGRRAAFAGAAALAVASVAYALVEPPLGLWPALCLDAADYSTRVGEQREIALAGGASIHLNTATRLNALAGASDAERFDLTAGEASFDTGADARLVVYARPGHVEATRASFLVHRKAAATRVICLRGIVQVGSGADKAALGGGFGLECGPDGLGRPSQVDLDVASAWRRGWLVFHDAPLADVVAEVNRYRPGRIVVLGAELGRRRVNARLPLRAVNTVVGLARDLLGAHVTNLPGGVVLLS